MPESSSSSPTPTPARSLAGESSGIRRVERSAGGVVVRIVGGSLHVLLIRDPYRKWGLPKGHLEEDEGVHEAAIREVEEETGLDSLILGPDLGEIDWTFRLKGRRVHKFCRFFLMQSEGGEARPQLSEGITECRWLPLEDAVRTVGYENARGVILRAADRIRIPSDEGRVPWVEEGPS